MSSPAAGVGIQRRRLLRRCALSGLLSWTAWMGWDVFHDIDAYGQATGPYESWQVLGSALTLLVVVVIAGWSLDRLDASSAFLVITLAYTAGFCVSAVVTAAFYPQGGANFWPLAAGVLFLGVGLGAYLVGGVVGMIGRAVRRGDGSPRR